MNLKDLEKILLIQTVYELTVERAIELWIRFTEIVVKNDEILCTECAVKERHFAHDKLAFWFKEWIKTETLSANQNEKDYLFAMFASACYAGDRNLSHFFKSYEDHLKAATDKLSVEDMISNAIKNFNMFKERTEQQETEVQPKLEEVLQAMLGGPVKD